MVGHNLDHKCLHKGEVNSCGSGCWTAVQRCLDDSVRLCTHVLLTHGAAEDSHQIEQRSKSIVMALNVDEHDLCKPFALQPLWQRLRSSCAEPAAILQTTHGCRMHLAAIL